MSKAAFRYPGSKEKLAGDIFRRFPGRLFTARLGNGMACYCEPFIGSGGVAMKALEYLPPTTRVVFGDMDYGIVCLWRAIHNDLEGLLEKIEAFEPSAAEFYRLKDLDGSIDGDPTEIGFRKFVLHQISFSGLGAKAGGPIGGADQGGDKGCEFDVGCRLKKPRHRRQLTEQSQLLNDFDDFEVIHGDFEQALNRVPTGGFAYLDPPYYARGGKLYVNNMSPLDHARLARVLQSAPYEWVLSYDENKAVRDLYEPWADIKAFEMTASIDIKRTQRRKSGELVITPKDRHSAETSSQGG